LAAPFGLEAQDPDAFLKSFIAAMPSHVLTGVRECLCRLTDPPIAAESYLTIMRRLRLTETATFLEDNLPSWRPLY
jgi:hypothetical protein